MPFITPFDLHEKDHKNWFLTFCIFLLSYFYISLRLDLWSGSDCEGEKKKVPQEKNCVPARRAPGLWCFESHHPSSWLFVSPWKCTLSKGYSASWCATLRRETTNEAAKKGHRNGAETVANLPLLLREQVWPRRTAWTIDDGYEHAWSVRRWEGRSHRRRGKCETWRPLFFFLSFSLSCSFYLATVKPTATTERHCLDAPKPTVKASLSSRSQTRHGRLVPGADR